MELIEDGGEKSTEQWKPELWTEQWMSLEGLVCAVGSRRLGSNCHSGDDKWSLPVYKHQPIGPTLPHQITDIPDHFSHQLSTDFFGESFFQTAWVRL